MARESRKAEIERLERELADLQRMARPEIPSADLDRLRGEVAQLRHDFYEHMGAWQRTLLARHPQRPYMMDYVRLLFEDFHELHGDRAYGDDAAMMAGFARYHGRPVVLVGQQKGSDTKQRVAHNFGQAKPEGYRKALRVMQLAAKFGRPIFTFIDTPGAYPGIDAEERGQAEAIARNLREMARLPVPIVVTITGEGGSGGALAIAVGDHVNMLENSVYSVISPEGCASILWRDAAKAEIAAEALKITARDLNELGIIDEIVPEPEGGAHLDHEASAALLDSVLDDSLRDLSRLTIPNSSSAATRNSAAWASSSRPLESELTLASYRFRPAKEHCWFRTTLQHLRCCAVPSRLVLEDGDRPLMSKQTGPPVSETARRMGRLRFFAPTNGWWKLRFLGKTFQVPEKNTILRCFQYISPETIPYGRFCWNQDCQYCRVVGKLTDEERPHDLLSCKFLVSAGMEITEISPELKYCLQNKLGK